MNIKPTKDNILIILEDKQTTESGIIIQSTKKTNRATVQAIGEDVTDVKVGDKVIFEHKSFTEWVEDGDKHIMVKEENIKALITS